MSESFDKKLVTRIRDVFENHEETSDQKLWERLDNRLSKRKMSHRHYLWVWSGSVAVVMVLLLVLFYPARNQLGVFTNKAEVENSIKENNFADKQNYDGLAKDETQNISEKEEIPSNTAEVNSNVLVEREENTKKDKMAKMEGTDDENVFTRDILSQLNKMERYSIQLRKTPASNTIITEETENKGTWDVHIPDQNDVEAEPKGENMKLGVSLASLYNYSSEKTTSEFNYGAGIESEIKLLQNVSLNTGVVLAKQYFRTTSSENQFYKAQNAPNSYETYDIDIEQTRRFELIGLDIPINLSYEYNKFLITAGLSSFLYIHQEVKEEFSTKSTLSNFMNGRFESSNTLSNSSRTDYHHAPLGMMDFVRTLNFSVGYQMEWDNADLIVEPFVKHPIGNQTNHDIRYGSSGLKLIYVF